MLAPKHPEEEKRLAALYGYDILDTDSEKSFDDIARLVSVICDTPIALISLVDGDRQWFKSEIGVGIGETALDVSICAHAILEREVFVVNDTLTDRRFSDNALVTGDPHLRFYAGAQLTTPDGLPLGSLCVLDSKPRELSDQQKDALEILAREVVSLMELRRLVRQQAEYLEERRLAIERLSVSESKHRNIAETLQSAMLMPPPTDKFPGLKVGTFYQGAWDEAEVAGDFFDAFALDNGKVALVLGDVTGKGLIAAAYTAEVKFALRAFLREESDPSRTMERLNRYLIDGRRLDTATHEDGADQYVALLIAVIDTKTGEMVCTGAGAEPPLLIQAQGSLYPVDVYGTMLGVDIESTYQAAKLHFEHGDIFVLTTDGITEARRRNPSGRGSQLFGYEGFTQAAVEAAKCPSSDAMAKAIAAAALDFADGAQTDDICLLVARFM